MRPKVYVINGEGAYVSMFLKNGWEVVNNPEDADAIQFTGGEDVDPMLYAEPKHPRTTSNPARDSRESSLFLTYEGEKVLLGICRGAQFLCVMAGGRMWQDVDNHALAGVHMALDLDTNEMIPVTSTHHQMMDPTTADNYEILMVAGRTTRKSDGWGNDVKQDVTNNTRDVEAVFFPDSNALCYQPHPEFVNQDHPCQNHYFELIRRHTNLGV